MSFFIVSTSFGNQNITNNTRNDEHPTLNHSSNSMTSSTNKQAWSYENQHLHSSTRSFPGDETDYYNNLRSVYQLTVDPDLSSIEVSKEIEKSLDMESPSRNDNLMSVDDVGDDEDALSTIMEANEPDTVSPTASLELSSQRTSNSKQIDDAIFSNDDHKHVSESSQSINPRDSQNIKGNKIVNTDNSQHQQQLLAHSTNKQSHLQASYTVQESCTVEKALENGLPVINSSDSNKVEKPHHKTGYIDVNASLDSEVSGMESEQKTEVLDHFLLRKSTEVIDNFLHRTSVDVETAEDGEEKLKYLGDSSSRNEDHNINVEQSQKLSDSDRDIDHSQQHHHTGLTNTNKSYNSLDNIKTSSFSSSSPYRHNKNISQSYDAKIRYPYNVNNTDYYNSKQTQSLDMKQMPDLKNASLSTNHQSKDSDLVATISSIAAVSVGVTTTSNYVSSSNINNTVPGKIVTNSNKSTLSQSYSAPYSSMLYQSTIGSGRGLSQSFDSGYRKPVVPQSKEVNNANTSPSAPSSEQREAYFNQVSYEHWPFTKSTNGDMQQQNNENIVEKVKDVNGHDIIVERLNILKRSLTNDDGQPPTLSSWVNESTNKARVSLEEREERLRQV